MEEVELIPPLVEGFIEQARGLRDEDRWALARARGAIDETFHAGAWRAANEIAARRADAYFEAWIRIGSAFIPDGLKELVNRGTEADPAEMAEWQGVARLARAGIDDALLALLGADTIRPPDMREMYGPWKAMLAAAHGGAEAPEVAPPCRVTEQPAT